MTTRPMHISWRERLAALLVALLLIACAQHPLPANPALWKVVGPHNQVAYLFGTIHSADQPLDWRTATVSKALNDSHTIMVEVANLANEGAVADTFARLAHSSAQPPLSQRVPQADRPALAALLRKTGYGDGDFAKIHTWAAALMLAKAGQKADDGRNGVDRAVIAAASPRIVVELEGAQKQLGLFNALSEKDQRRLLVAIIREATAPSESLTATWAKGDMMSLTRETRKGMLADPTLREVLFTGRNRAWTSRIMAAMASGQRPFVAVGAAHMAGPDGLPAMLKQRGFTVTRIE